MPGKSLRISEVRIQDFRCIKDLWLPLNPQITVLLGENNCGKTSFLEALGIALGERASIDDIRLESTGTPASSFIIDLKVVPGLGDEFDDVYNVAFGAAVQVSEAPQYVGIRAVGSDTSGRGDITVQRHFLQGWGTTRSEADRVKVMGRPSVTREILEQFQFHLLDAKRDIVEQFRSRSTFWGQMARDLSIEDETRGEIQGLLSSLGVKIVESSETLKAVRSELDLTSRSMATAGKVSISPIPAQVDDLVRSMDVLITSDNVSIPVGRHGMGTRSLAALLTFKAYVNLTLQKATATSVPISAFEEPEAHLHPQAQRAVYTLLSVVQGQKIISTHSPYVASLGDVFDFRRLHRENGNISMSMVPETENGAPTFEKDDAILLRRFIQARNGEVLFSRVVLLYEGQAEDLALPEFASHRWGAGGADQRGVSLVSVDGAGSMKHYTYFLDKLGIKWVCLMDGDSEGKKSAEAVCKRLGLTRADLQDRMVLLPEANGGSDFEKYILVDEGLKDEVEKAIEDYGGPGALQTYKRSHGGNRDYTSNGWHERLLLDYMRDVKGRLGRFLAKRVLETRVPALIDKVFCLAEKELS